MANQEQEMMKQKEVKSRLNSFVSNYNKTPKERFNLGYLEGRHSGLKDLWAEFSTNHKKLALIFSDDDRKTTAYFVNDSFAKYEDLYYETLGRISQKRIELTPTVSNVIPSLTPPLQQSSNQGQNMFHAQIPRLNVPTFSGLYEDWTSFHDLFVAAVHSNESIQPVHKLQYLKSLLKGDAELLLKQTPITAENYEPAWIILRDRFENKRAIINTSLRKLFHQQPADESAPSIRKLLDVTRECVNALHVQGIKTDTWDCILIFIISQRIPSSSITLWEQSIPRNTIPKFEQLLEFLENRFRILEFSPSQPQPSSSQSRIRTKPQAFHSVASACRLCNESPHALRLCAKFLQMLPAERLKHVTSAKLCKNCFSFSHQTQTCKSTGTCRMCNQRHHTLLHLNAQANHASTSSSNASPSTYAPIASTNHAAPASHTSSSSTPASNMSCLMSRPISADVTDSVLATAFVTVTAFDGQTHAFRALLDNASQDNFVSKRVVKILGIKPRSTSITISGVGQSQAPKPLGQIRFCFGSRIDPMFSMEINALVLPMITYALPCKPLIVDHQLIAGLELADPAYGTPNSIDILLSASTFAAITMPSLRKETTAATIALQTKLGWVLYGEATADSPQQQRTCFHITSDDRISTLLQDFWRVEEVPVELSLTEEDKRCEQIYEQTHSRKPDGRYSVLLPFKTDPPQLGSSRDRAVSRFLQIERKLAANTSLREEYSKCINEYIQLGHMFPTSSTEDQHRMELPDGSTTYSSYYLPHHAVIKEDSSTTKVRVVFDASCKTLNGVSLNEAMLIGPVLQDSMFNLLLRWRRHRIVIKADIEKMYRQIHVSEKHQPYQRIIWRNHPQEHLQEFQLRTVTFGTAAAPYLAIKTIYQLANDESTNFPEGADVLRNNFYVDDLLSGADSVAEAIEQQQQVVHILNRGGFQIRKWSSNHESVTDQIEETAKELCSTSDPTLKTLGILWNPRSDFLSIKVSATVAIVNTKRTLLSEVSKLFDPLGWISPTLICMKILLQKLWLAGLTWDEPLPSEIADEWSVFRRQLPSIEKIRISRWMNTGHNTPIQIHGFSDASEKAYAAVIYVRIQTTENKWAVHLITAKTRVAPVKQISIPRLELCAAVLLAKLLVAVRKTLQGSEIHAWTDSEIVLSWLQGHPNRWKTFVGNRVSEIHNSLDATVWHHVASKDNPADCASRGIPPDQLVNQEIWWHGPPWLTKDESCWPIKSKHQISSTQLELKKAQVFVTTSKSNDTLAQIMEDCSSLPKAIRVVARIRRWLIKRPSSGILLTVAEMDKASEILITHTQRTHFVDEYKNLNKDQPIHKSSKIVSLNPFLDEKKMIRVGGRLKNACIPTNARHPIILPRTSRFTQLLIHDAHIKTLHGGTALMLAYLRTQYWIVDARNTIRHQNHKCNKCFRFLKETNHQLMGNLPAPRVNITHPFTHTGIDYAGPISVLLRRRAGRPTYTKGYICVFVCLATKAIHLELVGDMTAQTFIAALDRFVSRRGLPSDMYSDNGTYFVRANQDVDQDMLHVQREYPKEAARNQSHQSIQWHFIPPAAPHFGGLWEAGVKSMKHHLKRIVGDGSCTYEELLTILCQIESCLNSRPLCPISADPDDFEILTPGHFLVGRQLLARPQPNILEIPTNRLSHWQQVYTITQRFWKQWQMEYITRLQQRPKWLSQTPNVNKGDLVILKEDNIPPSQWKLARILETHAGSDGLIRVVTIKTPTTILKRPVVKISQLPSQ